MRVVIPSIYSLYRRESCHLVDFSVRIKVFNDLTEDGLCLLQKEVVIERRVSVSPFISRCSPNSQLITHGRPIPAHEPATEIAGRKEKFKSSSKSQRRHLKLKSLFLSVYNTCIGDFDADLSFTRELHMIDKVPAFNLTQNDLLCFIQSQYLTLTPKFHHAVSCLT